MKRVKKGLLSVLALSAVSVSGLLGPDMIKDAFAFTCKCRCRRVSEVCEYFQTGGIDNVTEWDYPTAHSLCLTNSGTMQVDKPDMIWGTNCSRNCFRWGIGDDCDCYDGVTAWIPTVYMGSAPYYETIWYDDYRWFCREGTPNCGTCGT